MEPKKNCVTTGGIAVLGGLFLIQLLTLQLASALAQTIALPRCQPRCGDVEIPYPFGIGRNCSMEAGFTLDCKLISNGTYKPFLDIYEFLSISLSLGQARIANLVLSICYNATDFSVTSEESWTIDFTALPYRFSSTLNKFTTVGCETLAYIRMNKTADSYVTGCVSLCGDKKSLINGSCSGIGCCQTAIPKGITYYDVSFDLGFNSSDTYQFSQCGYAVLVEERVFKFNTSCITTGELQGKKLPVVLDWAVRNKTCWEAQQDRASYACVSNNSECVDSLNDTGYLCNCKEGYEGNPYLANGCRDIDECAK
ncbi:wall-associated receptor kinase 2-like [Ananas comosus]|uniref:Wall-associated receptor kinase 2-like n=1 Tax=Ananas comosus TaxID=4615 RepID=A0A6P5EAR8_ANACO|nr:wall-associated receptor kinase 2-like [Ananas comosus]